MAEPPVPLPKRRRRRRLSDLVTGSDDDSDVERISPPSPKRPAEDDREDYRDGLFSDESMDVASVESFDGIERSDEVPVRSIDEDDDDAMSDGEASRVEVPRGEAPRGESPLGEVPESGSKISDLRPSRRDGYDIVNKFDDFVRLHSRGPV